MKFSVMSLPLLPMTASTSEEPAETLKRIYKEIKAVGIRAVDISTIDLQFGGEAAVLEALATNELTCSCYLAFISAPGVDQEGQEAAIRQGKESVDKTLRLGSGLMMFVPFQYQAAAKKYDRGQMAQRFVDVLQPVVEYAKERGVTVGIEDAPHLDFPMCTAGELRFLLEAVPGLKLIYDTGNMCFCGEDPLSFYEGLFRYAVHGHAKDICKDSDGKPMECPHGQGIVDFQGIFQQMERDGFDGYMAVELAPDFSSEQAVFQRMRSAFEALTGT